MMSAIYRLAKRRSSSAIKMPFKRSSINHRQDPRHLIISGTLSRHDGQEQLKVLMRKTTRWKIFMIVLTFIPTKAFWIALMLSFLSSVSLSADSLPLSFPASPSSSIGPIRESITGTSAAFGFKRSAASWSTRGNGELPKNCSSMFSPRA